MKVFRIYVASLEHYNNGQLLGEWLDLDYKTGEEIREEIQELLKKWEVEEYAIHDHENLEGLYSEYGMDFDAVADYIDAYNEHGESAEAYMELFGEWNKEDFEDRYHGEFDSDEALAEEYIESTGMLDGLDEALQCYFNYASFGRDLSYDYSEYNGHYFRSY